MGKRDRELERLYREMLAMLRKSQDPASNPAQQYLTNEALAGANWLKGGDYSQMPKGMFFNFEMPSEQIKRYEKASEVNPTGVFALGDGSGSGAAAKSQNQFLRDKFARDTALNYQNNIAGAAGQIQGALGQAAGHKTGQDQAIIAAMQGLSGHPWLNKKGNNWLGSLLQMGGQIGSSAISAASLAGAF